MSWWRRLLTHVPGLRPEEPQKAQRAHQVIRKADQLLEDYRRQDKALLIIAVKRR